MPRGAAPGERRGGRQKGTPNKFTVGKAFRAMRANTVDGALENLSRLLIATVPDPQARQTLAAAFDRYVDARERAAQKSKRSTDPAQESASI
jgi:predicted Zn-dependent protease